MSNQENVLKMSFKMFQVSLYQHFFQNQVILLKELLISLKGIKYIDNCDHMPFLLTLLWFINQLACKNFGHKTLVQK